MEQHILNGLKALYHLAHKEHFSLSDDTIRDCVKTLPAEASKADIVKEMRDRQRAFSNFGIVRSPL